MNQGVNSIAIGNSAGALNGNTIVINATGIPLDTPTGIPNAFFAKPIRDVTGNTGFSKILVYNPTTGEIGLSG
jgi:hypothetical protein